MAKRIVILEQQDVRNFRYLLWADVPVTRTAFYADATNTSAWTGASAAEVLAIQNGQVVEHVNTLIVPQGTTIASVRTILEAQWAEFQARVTNENKWIRYGTYWDGTSWTAGGVN